MVPLIKVLESKGLIDPGDLKGDEFRDGAVLFFWKGLRYANSMLIYHFLISEWFH